MSNNPNPQDNLGSEPKEKTRYFARLNAWKRKYFRPPSIRK